ncbi:bromo adjacent like protein [Purpureocillium lilacinum]|uniref:Bromo adjacent like protein n=1 Tax=Purpureocillium lilacinum TaxID=33203 RepID=A0A179GC47_PURLI|nr:bromo adjacent like protein [Purpureocillium lilacinum]OAQ75080.1 bromo adjacent like protein [Purpureocillium lilacinum]
MVAKASMSHTAQNFGRQKSLKAFTHALAQASTKSHIIMDDIQSISPLPSDAPLTDCISIMPSQEDSQPPQDPPLDCHVIVSTMNPAARRGRRMAKSKSRALCPFSVVTVSTKRKRKRDTREIEQERWQGSPFEPKGRFSTHDTMDLTYIVEPHKGWSDMTRYNRPSVKKVQYYNDDFVYVATQRAIAQQKSSGLLQLADCWVAKILEIRARDQHHVYARVYWMYSPDDLPSKALENNKLISGRQAYHGQNEFISVDVIDAVSVVMRAQVRQWVESDDEAVQDSLYWRQTVDLTCYCKMPANPDKTLIGCSNPSCDQWLHYECLLHACLMSVYEQLGTDKPHKTELASKGKTVVNPQPDVQAKIAAKEDDTTKPAAGEKESEKPYSKLECTNGLTSQPAGTPEIATEVMEVAHDKLNQSEHITESGRKERGNGAPYAGLFDAKLRLDRNQAVWEVADLRQNIPCGDREWELDVKCLVCGSTIT